MASLANLLLPQTASAGGARYNDSRRFHLEESKIYLLGKVNYTNSDSIANICQVSKIKCERKFETICNKRTVFNKVKDHAKGKLSLSYGTTPWRCMGEWKHSSTVLDISTRWLMVACMAMPLYLRYRRPLYSLSSSVTIPTELSRFPL
jgi:hypothetical protein